MANGATLASYQYVVQLRYTSASRALHWSGSGRRHPTQHALPAGRPAISSHTASFVHRHDCTHELLLGPSSVARPAREPCIKHPSICACTSFSLPAGGPDYTWPNGPPDSALARARSGTTLSGTREPAVSCLTVPRSRCIGTALRVSSRVVPCLWARRHHPIGRRRSARPSVVDPWRRSDGGDEGRRGSLP